LGDDQHRPTRRETFATPRRLPIAGLRRLGIARHPGRALLVLAAAAGLIVLALVAVTGGQALTETVLALVAATLVAVGGLASFFRMRATARSRRERDDAIGAALEEVQAATLVLDRLGIVLDASPSTAAILGYQARELVGLRLDSLADPAHADDIADAIRGSTRGSSTRAWRLRHRDGHWVSVEATPAARADGPKAGHIALAIHDVTRWTALEEALTRQAFHDPLTGLPNRALYIDRLEHALSRRRRMSNGTAVLFVDLDDFKNVNDSLGHQEGDLLISQVGERLVGTVRPEDTAARLGGDEFALLLVEVDEAQAEAVASRVLHSFDRPYQLSERSIRMAGSVGVAHTWSGLHTATDMLRAADLAMYEAKGAGKGQYRVFEPSMHQAANDRLQLGADLRLAIDRQEFTLHYQPTVELPGRGLSSMEALVRWNHPERGLVAPGEFIPLAESTGLIIPIGEFVLREACRQARAWQLARSDMPPVTVNVNLSGVQLEHPGIVAAVSLALEDAELAPELLTLEITESVMARETDATLRRLKQLKGLGVRLAIDDFGTGYSSLAYLRRFPIDFVKIDKSFIDGVADEPGQLAFVRAIVRLAHTLKTTTVAEGVEHEAQAKRLSSIGCDLAQGFHFSRPMDAAEATEYIVGHTTISFWLGHRDAELEVIKEVVADFERANPEIRVNVVGDVGDAQIQSEVRSGRGPNVVSTSESDQFAAYWSDGLLLDLGPYMAHDQIDSGQFLGPTNVYTSEGGRRWSLPMLADAYGLFFDRTRFEAAGLAAAPRTIDELTDYAKRLTSRRGDGSLDVVGFMPLFGFYENFVANFAHMFGARWVDSTGRSSLASDPAWATMLRWQKDLVDWYGVEDLKRFEAELGEEFSTTNAFHQRRLAMVIDGGWRVAMLAAQAPKLDYGTAPVPVHGSVPELYGSGYMNGSIIGIPSDADHKTEAWKLVRYLATDVEALAKLSNGLRNVPSTMASLASPLLAPDERFGVFLDISAHPWCSTAPITALGAQYQAIVETFLEEWQSGAASDLLAGLRAVDRQIDALIEQAARPRRQTTVAQPRRPLRSLAG
jgi:diguanylate cyclase (GGDEF)-like protein/PAS domain S-box-containing protein